MTCSARRCHAVALMLAVAFAVTLLGPRQSAGLPKVPANAFEPAEECGCHAGLLEQWSTSMHAKALSDPAYVVKRAEGEKALKGLGAFCDTCHAPVATMSGELVTGKLSPQSAEGIGCGFCHQVAGTTMPPGDVSQIVDPDGTMRAQLKRPQSPHAAAYSAFHKSSEFCGACHNVNHPLNGMHLEATYTEWKQSPYAKQGVTCQRCHMTPGPGVTMPNPGKAAGGGPVRKHIYTMTFAGANVAQGDPYAATANLKAAATLDLEVPETIAAGASSLVTVTVTNVGAGHYLPTGLTELRQMWLEVSAIEPDGSTTELGRRDFVTELEDAKGNHPVELWDAVSVHSDDRIPPLGSVKQAYTITMPKQPSTKVVAVLNYRSLSDELAEKAKVENPVTEMAKAEQVVRAAEEAPAGGSEPDESAPGDGSTPPIAAAALLAGIAVVGGIAFFALRRRTSA